MIQLYEIPFSTNVERITLALAYKGLDVEHVEVDPADRGLVQSVSGQELVPVLVHDARVVVDSTVILEYLEECYPDPPLYPSDPPLRAEVSVFIDWFNRVWKRWPNEIEGELRDGPNDERVARLADKLRGSRDLFEALLTGRDYLFGEFSAADCAAFPFLKYGVIWDEEDDQLFHRILIDHLRLDGSHPQLEAWIRRLDQRPRA